MSEPKLVYTGLNRTFIKENKLDVVIGSMDCESSMDAYKMMKSSRSGTVCGCRDANKELCEEIRKEYGHSTIPLVFIDGEFIGGYKELLKR